MYYIYIFDFDIIYIYVYISPTNAKIGFNFSVLVSWPFCVRFFLVDSGAKERIVHFERVVEVERCIEEKLRRWVPKSCSDWFTRGKKAQGSPFAKPLPSEWWSVLAMHHAFIFWSVKVGDTHMGRPYFAIAFWLAGEANMYQRLAEYRSNPCSVPFLQCFQIDQTGDCPPVWPADQQWPAPRLSSDQSGRKQLSPLRHVCLRPGNQGI